MDTTKPGYQTTEFWGMVVNTIVGLLTMIGIIAPAAKDALTQTLMTGIGAIMTLSGVIAYVWARTFLKAKTTAEVVKP